MKLIFLYRDGVINKDLNTYVSQHEDSDNCACRKPKTGLFKRVLDDKDIDVKKIYFIGDKESDVIAGHRIGC